MNSAAPRDDGYRFPPLIISHAVWLYHRFCLSFRDAEDLLAQRGLTVSYETIRARCRTFGPAYARSVRRLQGRVGDTWYLDELFRGTRHYVWRAVGQDGDVIDVLVQSRRDRQAAARFFRKLLTGQGRTPRRDHGQAAQLRGGAPHCDAVSRTQHPAVREQSRGGVAPADATTRAADATIHIRRAGAALLVGAWPRPESLSCRTSPAARRHPSQAENACLRCVAGRDLCLLRSERGRHPPDDLALRPST